MRVTLVKNTRRRRRRLAKFLRIKLKNKNTRTSVGRARVHRRDDDPPRGCKTENTRTRPYTTTERSAVAVGRPPRAYTRDMTAIVAVVQPDRS